ncbi:MAG: glycoside hydrolase family 43 protein [Marinilabiliaceae bacterium]|nr:glycoside hydrolase family 43 protein [Marinilabiliaceae bacterium]
MKIRKSYFLLLILLPVFVLVLAKGGTKKKDLDAYLMVYFKDATHGVHIAVSDDGYTFTSVNDEKAVIAGDTIAGQKGIRDPHIYRGPDDVFYMVMTDLHIFGKAKGFRDTDWERPMKEYDWGNNRGFVLMKSKDLIHWEHHTVYIEDFYPNLNVGCAWAPQTIYDPKEKKMMLYFTMRIGHGLTKMYYAYTNKDFTGLVSEPKILFDFPNPDIQVLDADICPMPDGRYCMTYVSQEGPCGIRIAYSDKINRDYTFEDKFVDFAKGSCEAPNVWKRKGEDKWVLMYDIFSLRPHNFGFAETSDFKSFTDLGYFNEGRMKTTNFITPKHGAVIQITKKEAERLKNYWKNQKTESNFTAYLFAYFEGAADSRKSEEQLRFALSRDAINWTALNSNNPVLSSDEISQTGGIRDPHILRGEDNESYYMVATDMSTAKNGWKSNPGITMLKSNDLINWKHGIVDLSRDYPATFANAYWVWAPQTIYDPVAKKYLVYFTVRFKDDDKLDFYCAYANKDFSGFENEPTLMFSPKHGAIDGDIIYKDGIYHLFYKGNTKDENGKEFENGIKQATATSLQGPWTEHFDYLDVYHGTRTHVEGSSIFKLNNSDEYLLMYDLYSSGRYEFQRSTDLYHFTVKPESFTKDFHPRHGSVISLTEEEVTRINQKWGNEKTMSLK